MLRWNSWLRGRADRSSFDRTAPPVRIRSGGLTPPGSPAPRPFLIDARSSDFQRVGAQLRPIVADALGVAADELTADVSLVDDLAADSLDLLELVLAAETEFDVTIPERALVDVRTYGDLIALVARAVKPARHPVEPPEPAPVWARVVPAAPATSCVERALALTPYAVQTIEDDALHAGRGARLEVEVPASSTDATVATVQERFARLGEYGVQVNVRRRLGPLPASTPRPAAAATR